MAHNCPFCGAPCGGELGWVTPVPVPIERRFAMRTDETRIDIYPNIITCRSPLCRRDALEHIGRGPPSGIICDIHGTVSFSRDALPVDGGWECPRCTKVRTQTLTGSKSDG